ncbi:fumarate reductase subunit FrdD [Xylanimonas ulmi]|uniref:Succinate dehydrogenase subunit D n=1 Tax=Xylanimonas ulmi TaxID=228973 RepID=A0A4Q7LYN9_9MICO|nr:fumarate reductase subunit FrdD [Xylanibacterium ulmi]RZS59811.1 succinate dehydrogenase subunit D [Xylanibacterium ulmi]
MRRWESRNNESVMWALFAGGGQLAVLVMPAVVIVFGVIVPFEVFGDAATTYRSLAGVATHPAASFAILATLGVILWHCCHRGYHALHDLHLNPPEIVRAATYGLAIVIPAGGWALCLAS